MSIVVNGTTITDITGKNVDKVTANGVTVWERASIIFNSDGTGMYTPYLLKASVYGTYTVNDRKMVVTFNATGQTNANTNVLRISFNIPSNSKKLTVHFIGESVGETGFWLQSKQQDNNYYEPYWFLVDTSRTTTTKTIFVHRTSVDQDYEIDITGLSGEYYITTGGYCNGNNGLVKAEITSIKIE